MGILKIEKISQISDYLAFRDGIWQANSKSTISYPKEGNINCYDVEDNSFWFIHRSSIVIDVIKRYSVGSNIFDVGGGNGQFTLKLSLEGYNAFLVEPGINGILNAHRRGIRNLIMSSFQEAGFKENSIENISLLDVLEHIIDHEAFLRAIRYSLIPRGRLFLTVPALNILWSKEDGYAGHYRRYRQSELKDILINNGFNVLYSSFFFSFLVIPILLFRVVPSKLGIYNLDSKSYIKHHDPKLKKNKILSYIMKLEGEKVKQLKSISIGSSLIVVAEKNDYTF